MSTSFITSHRVSLIAATVSWALSPFAGHASTQFDPAHTPAAVMKATSIQIEHWQTEQDNDLDAYFASEKLDGIRAIWTGDRLITRQGNPLYPPAWFTASLPRHVTVEGELWLGRGQFQHLSHIVLDDTPNETQWRNVRFMLFDAPSAAGTFSQRLAVLKHITQHVDPAVVQLIEQRTLTDTDTLETWLKNIERNGGEGIMLHRKDNPYFNGRSAGVLKVKSYQDDEAIVTGYEPGKGKYAGLMGAVWVVTADNIRFKIGSGFRDYDRANPPAVGSIIQYRFNGYTQSGKPRFARYIRPRQSPDS